MIEVFDVILLSFIAISIGILLISQKSYKLKKIKCQCNKYTNKFVLIMEIVQFIHSNNPEVLGNDKDNTDKLKKSFRILKEIL